MATIRGKNGKSRNFEAGLKKYTAKEVARMTPEDVRKLTTDEAYAAARVAQKSVNAAYSRLRKAGISTPATIYLERHGGPLTLEGKRKDRGAILKELALGIGYMNTKTGTKSGYTKHIKESFKGSEADKAYYLGLSDEEKAEYWRIVKFIKSRNIGAYISSDQLNTITLQVMAENVDPGEMIKRIEAQTFRYRFEELGYKDTKKIPKPTGKGISAEEYEHEYALWKLRTKKEREERRKRMKLYGR